MSFSLEIQSLGWAVLASLFSLAGAWLSIGPIKGMTAGGPIVSAETSTEIMPSAQVIDEGRNFFGQSCSHCHGDDAHGDEGPDLHNLAISNARIATTIKKGIKGEMPSFAKKYDDRQIAELVSYLRTLR